MKCSNCQHEQDSGKFCGKCGTVLTAQAGGMEESPLQKTQEESTSFSATATPSAAAPVYQAPVEPNQHVEKVKETSKQYWNYFLQYLKKPGSILEQPSNNLVNALITIAVFALIFSLAIYKNLSIVLQPFEEIGGIFGESQNMMPSFFSVFFSSVLCIALIFLLSSASLYLVNKFAGPDKSFKNIISAFGTLLIPSTVLMIVAYVLLLIESLIIGNVLAIASLSFSISVMPLYLMTALLKQSSKAIDSFYAFIAYIIIFAISLSILMSVFFDSTIGQYIDAIREGFYF